MVDYRKLKIGRKNVEALCMRLGKKNLIVIKARRGYVMCGYLDLKVAERFQEVAVKITGVSSIAEALEASVHSCTQAARKLGIRAGQPLSEVLTMLA